MKKWNIYFRIRDDDPVIRIQVESHNIVDAIIRARRQFTDTFNIDSECIRACLSTSKKGE